MQIRRWPQAGKPLDVADHLSGRRLVIDECTIWSEYLPKWAPGVWGGMVCFFCDIVRYIYQSGICLRGIAQQKGKSSLQSPSYRMTSNST